MLGYNIYSIFLILRLLRVMNVLMFNTSLACLLFGGGGGGDGSMNIPVMRLEKKGGRGQGNLD